MALMRRPLMSVRGRFLGKCGHWPDIASRAEPEGAPTPPDLGKLGIFSLGS
jgi:hypothetical protein